MWKKKKAQVINDDILDHDDFTLKLQLTVCHCTHHNDQQSYTQKHANAIKHSVVK